MRDWVLAGHVTDDALLAVKRLRRLAEKIYRTDTFT
jgi:hypothetical protein